jgi:hypothetical protein
VLDTFHGYKLKISEKTWKTPEFSIISIGFYIEKIRALRVEKIKTAWTSGKCLKICTHAIYHNIIVGFYSNPGFPHQMLGSYQLVCVIVWKSYLLINCFLCMSHDV